MAEPFARRFIPAFFFAALVLLPLSKDAVAQPQNQTGFAYVHFSATTDGDDVFVFGGSVLGRGRDLQTGNFRVEPTTGRVEEISSDLIFGTGSAASETDGLVFVSGGLGSAYRRLPQSRYSGRFSDIFAMYNIAENSWTRLPDLPFKLHNHCSTAFGGDIYILGGEYEFRRGIRTEYAPLTQALRYSISDQTWVTIPLPAGASAVGAACTRLGSEYFVIGGSRGQGLSRQVWVWNIAANTWRQAPDLPFPVGSAAAASVGDLIVLAGGYSYEGASPRTIDTHVWTLSTGANEWRSTEDVIQRRYGHGMAVAAGSVWLFGGADEQSLRPPNYSGALNGWWLERLGVRATTEPQQNALE